MKATQLAQALAHMTDGKSAADARAATDKFIEYLRARRLTKLLPAVLREYKNVQHGSAKSRGVRLTVARKADADTARAIAGAAAVDAEVVVNDAIVGGYILETATEHIDASYRGKLVALYRSLFI